MPGMDGLGGKSQWLLINNDSADSDHQLIILFNNNSEVITLITITLVLLWTKKIKTTIKTLTLMT